MGIDPRIGTEIAGYRIEEVLGRGGMSIVYLAEHLGLRRQVAFKVLAPELALEEGFRERFIRESRLAASIDHPNIIPIYDAGQSDDVLFIAMRYVDGSDLKVLLREFGPLEPGKLVSILAQTAAALDAAHARGLVHRDVKPGNILIAGGVGAEGADHVYLADFGLTKKALSVSGMTATGQLVGTIDYVAPEQIKAEPIDGRTDIYSLGCVVFEALTGTPPYKFESEVAVLWAHVQGDPPSVADRRPDLPAGIDSVIDRAMAKKPGDRYRTAGQLAAAVRDELGVVSAPVVHAMPKPPRRRRIFVVASALLAVAGAAAAVLLTRQAAPAAFPTGPNTVAVIDPASYQVVDGIGVGQSPSGIANGEGGVWVANFADQTVSRLDPETREEVVRPGGVGRASGIAAGGGGVWVAAGLAGTVSVIDPPENKVTATIDAIPGAWAVAVGGGSVWVTSDTGGQVVRIDPHTQQPVAPPIQVGVRPDGIAADADGVWVANSLSSSVTRIDPSTGHVAAPDIAVGCQPDQVAIGPQAVWVTCTEQNMAVKIDPSTNQGAISPTVGVGPTGIAVTKNAVWVACSQDGRVWALDPRTGRVLAKVPVHGSPQGVAEIDGRIWVTVRAA
ncbi:MAG TPA: serine/threonine-protein kinase [Actinomycetota bacterium]|jgi:serine/threonine-protein kinase